MAKKKAEPVDVRAELLEAYGVKPKKNEEDAALAERVAKKMSDDEDEEKYDALSDEAKAWYEEAAEALGEGGSGEVEPMPTLEEEEEEEEEKPKKSAKKAAKKSSKKDEEEEEEEEEKPKKKSKKKDEEEEEEESEPRVSGADTIRQIMASKKKPGYWTVERVQAKLEEKEVEVDEKRVYRLVSQINRFIEICDEKGIWQV